MQTQRQTHTELKLAATGQVKNTSKGGKIHYARRPSLRGNQSFLWANLGPYTHRHPFVCVSQWTPNVTGSGKIQRFVHIPSKLRFCYILHLYVWIAKIWASKSTILPSVSYSVCNAAITIANIESGKLVCAHTQNRTLFSLFFSHKINDGRYFSLLAIKR